MARPAFKDRSTVRDAILMVRFTPAELQEFTDLAAEMGVTVSDVVRRLLSFGMTRMSRSKLAKELESV